MSSGRRRQFQLLGAVVPGPLTFPDISHAAGFIGSMVTGKITMKRMGG
jgi:hypothetical protein